MPFRFEQNPSPYGEAPWSSMVRRAGWSPAVRQSFVPVFVRCIQLRVQEFARLGVLGSARYNWRPGGAITAGAAIGLSPPHPSAHMPELLQARTIAGTTPMPAVPKASGMYVREMAGIRFVAKKMIRLAMVVWRDYSKIPIGDLRHSSRPTAPKVRSSPRRRRPPQTSEPAAFPSPYADAL